jgi:cell division protein FtsB
MGPQKGFLTLRSTKKNKKRKLWRIPLIVFCILGPIVAWLGFGEQGLIHLYHTEIERQAYIERIRQLTEENQALLDEINRLRTDMKYVEDVARKHFNMIKEDEVIYRFGEEKKRGEDTEALPIKARNSDNIEKAEREDLRDEAIK